MLEHIVKSLDDVPEQFRELYTEIDDGFEIQVKGVAEMRRAKTREKQRAQEAESKMADLQEQLDAIRDKQADDEDNASRKKGDVDALEKSWQAKLEKLTGEKDTAIHGLEGQLQAILVDGEANRIAAELAVEGSAAALVPHIKSRLAADSREGKYTTVVLDGEGKPSAATLDDLRAEISGNRALAPLIAGSKASGIGATGGKPGGGAATKSGNWTGSKDEQEAAIRARFPELA